MTRKAPGPTARSRAKRRRADEKVASKVRAACVERDGYCRLGFDCDGRSEWAHLGDRRRAKTRGMAPTHRHSTAHSLMLCTRHHRRYDNRLIEIEPLTAEGANGPIRYMSVNQTAHRTNTL